MKLLMCENGHFFDADETEKCHCGAGIYDVDSKKQKKETVSDEDTVLITPPIVPEENVMKKPVSYNMYNKNEENKQKKEGDMSTVALYSSPIGQLAGWLVCVNGNSYGECFGVKVGKNYIGRSIYMDIAMVKESSILKEKHAMIEYDSQSCKFFIRPGVHALSYVNGIHITKMTELKIYDEVKLGLAVFVFIPLCGLKFDWSHYEK